MTKYGTRHTQYQTHDFTRNRLLTQYTITLHCVHCSKVTSLVSMAAFLRPYVSLVWNFDAIRWSWLSCIGACRVGKATKGWSISFIFNLECCEHKKGPVGPPNWTSGFQLSSYSILHSYIKLTLHPPLTTPITTMCNNHCRHEKSCLKQLEVGVFESYSPTQL